MLRKNFLFIFKYIYIFLCRFKYGKSFLKIWKVFIGECLKTNEKNKQNFIYEESFRNLDKLQQNHDL